MIDLTDERVGHLEVLDRKSWIDDASKRTKTVYVVQCLNTMKVFETTRENLRYHARGKSKSCAKCRQVHVMIERGNDPVETRKLFGGQ